MFDANLYSNLENTILKLYRCSALRSQVLRILRIRIHCQCAQHIIRKALPQYVYISLPPISYVFHMPSETGKKNILNMVTLYAHSNIYIYTPSPIIMSSFRQISVTAQQARECLMHRNILVEVEQSSIV